MIFNKKSSKKKFWFKNKPKPKENQNLPRSYVIKVSRKSFLIRSWLVLFFVIGLLGIVYSHTLYLQIYQHEKYEVSSLNNYVKVVPIPPERGIITDRNGIGLAINRLEYGLFMNYVSPRQAEKNFSQINEYIPITNEDKKRYLSSRRNNIYKYPTLVKANLNQEEISKVLVNNYLFSDFSVQPVYTRYYPFGKALPHTLGYVSAINDRDEKKIKNLPEAERSNYAGTNTIGKLGLEKYYEKLLHGNVGYQSVEVDSKGNIIKTLESQEPEQGANLRIAIDLPLQIFIQDLVKDQRAAVIVSNPNTSEILAMVSNPVFDNNEFVGGISSTSYKILTQDIDKPLYNRTTLGVYPPGSTIKPFMSFIGLDTGFVNKNTTIFDPGYWVLPGTKQTFRDWKRSGHGKVNVHKAITESVDTYYYDLAYRMGIDLMAQYMKKFGFGNKTGIDVTEESSALYPTSEWKQKRYKRPWVAGDTPPVGIGQGYFHASPIQLLKALNTTINHGEERTPHLLISSNNAQGLQEYSFTATQIFPEAKKDDWDTVLKGMWGVTNQGNGSGYRAFFKTNYVAAGKSGTAQVFNLKGADYKASKLDKRLHDHALFIAYAPYDSPQVSIVVIIENGGGGSKVAAPIARASLDYYLNQRLPHSDPSLSCNLIQKNAITDLEALGYQVNLNEEVFNLNYLTSNSCVKTTDEG